MNNRFVHFCSDKNTFIRSQNLNSVKQTQKRRLIQAVTDTNFPVLLYEIPLGQSNLTTGTVL